ncbi:MAG TPA: nuclear transport factor 2 family protein [Streptosporangiaceae bacterium]|nr:nuclear transport factor 2 family protein [Streptosporangiaceae bacterium]
MTATAAETDLARLYFEVNQFYARHMHLLDAGDADAWADGFTPDGEFQLPSAPQPARGRQALADGVRRSAAEQKAAGEVHRHWHGMVTVDPVDDGSVHVSCYALVLATALGGATRLHRACVCEDVLVRSDGRWLIRSRRVTRDDLPSTCPETTAT